MHENKNNYDENKNENENDNNETIKFGLETTLV